MYNRETSALYTGIPKVNRLRMETYVRNRMNFQCDDNPSITYFGIWYEGVADTRYIFGLKVSNAMEPFAVWTNGWWFIGKNNSVIVRMVRGRVKFLPPRDITVLARDGLSGFVRKKLEASTQTEH